MIHDGIKNNLTAYSNIEILNKDNKEIIALHITSAPNKPYYISEKGLKPSLRIGSSSINATDEIIRKMILENNITSFEEEISVNQDLTFDYAAKIFANEEIEFDEKKYKALKLITDNKYNNLALLLSDQNPYTIKCAIYEGLNKTIFKDRKILTGSCLKQINDAFEYLNLVNRVASTFEGLVRIDKKDYPNYSLRESLINAILHRSYYFNGSILLSSFDDRIEINSTGGLLSSLTLNDIYNGVSESRNPNLAELFHRLHYVENYGTGIGRMLNEYDNEKNKPVIEISENVFKITLPNRNYVKIKEFELTQQEEKIVEYLKLNNTITRENIQKILELSKSGARNIIKTMMENDIIELKGNGKSSCYVLKNNINEE